MFNKTGAVRDGEVVWRLDEAQLRQEQELQAAVSWVGWSGGPEWMLVAASGRQAGGQA